MKKPEVLGLLIVAISMVALINTITMVVLERTREIGRCIVTSSVRSSTQTSSRRS